MHEIGKRDYDSEHYFAAVYLFTTLKPIEEFRQNIDSNGAAATTANAIKNFTELKWVRFLYVWLKLILWKVLPSARMIIVWLRLPHVSDYT